MAIFFNYSNRSSSIQPYEKTSKSDNLSIIYFHNGGDVVTRKSPQPEIINPAPNAPLLYEKEFYVFLAEILIKKQRKINELQKSDQTNTITK